MRTSFSKFNIFLFSFLEILTFLHKNFFNPLSIHFCPKFKTSCIPLWEFFLRPLRTSSVQLSEVFILLLITSFSDFENFFIQIQHLLVLISCISYIPSQKHLQSSFNKFLSNIQNILFPTLRVFSSNFKNFISPTFITFYTTFITSLSHFENFFLQIQDLLVPISWISHISSYKLL